MDISPLAHQLPEHEERRSFTVRPPTAGSDVIRGIILRVEVLVHASAAEEYRSLPEREQEAMDNAIEKLQVLGGQLGYPHSSAVKRVAGVRELRPRAGRSRWRAFYRLIGANAVIGAFGPEASVDARGFRAAVERAIERFAEAEPENG